MLALTIDSRENHQRTLAGNDTFGSEVAMQGNIANGGFTGNAQSGGQEGRSPDISMVPQLKSLGGLAQFADHD
ncbi:Uncharacterised protein [Leclercia adecarboxylata]|uniref:Uncharacterized protein n=1 Tax=Leclercia adecarboxylata TaxID=83655 RepID=A0A4U9HVP2_9ENTR|nr:Uncharacterised protein [Leclercia adecarboxylata]